MCVCVEGECKSTWRYNIAWTVGKCIIEVKNIWRVMVLGREGGGEWSH